MPHLHHGASGSFGSVLLTVMLVFTARLYLARMGFIFDPIAWPHSTAWRACSFLLGLS